MSTRTVIKNDVQVHIFRDARELALGAGRHFAELARQYVVGTGRFTVALPGGSTPGGALAALAGEPLAGQVPWSSIYFFWGDERAVPPDHAASNYRLAEQTLLSKVPVPRENVFRIAGEMEDLERAAEDYSAVLRKIFAGSPARTGSLTALANWPRFDLILLGMGTDGHTASLFPDTAALAVNDRIAVVNYVPKLSANRITLTFPTINNARNVSFLVAGEDKAAVLKQLLEGPQSPELFPSQQVRPRSGALLWMVDEAAASLLSK
jgi:6-phosphogluconolactonase